MAAIKFYLDENVSVVIAEQLLRRGIDAVTVWDIGQLGDTDENHLARAQAMGCVLVTHDKDFLRMARAGQEHAGIVFGRQDRTRIGIWVLGLASLYERFSAEEMHNRVEFL